MRSLLPLIFLAACAADVATTDELDVAIDDGKADSTSEASVRAGDTTLWVQKSLARRGDDFVLRGRASRNLTDGNAFIFDDVYGAFTQKSARTFEVVWSVSEIRSLADGVDQFLRLSFVHSSSRPDSLTGRVVVRPRIATFSGSSKIYLVAELKPVVVAGLVSFRLAGHTYGTNTGVRAMLGGVELPAARSGNEDFSIDLTPDQAFAASNDLQVIADFPTGGVDKRVTLGLAVKTLGMTTGDAYDVWPRATCTTKTKSCLLSLSDGALDLGKCGVAIDVLACQGQVGVTVDDVSFQATLHDADVRLANAQADATALVGRDKANEWLFGAKEFVEVELQQIFGRWTITQAARKTLLDRALEGGLDHAYARPLDVVEGHSATANIHDIVGDAVLAEIARMDLVHTEFSRSLEQLVHEYRAQHIASIGAFRTTVEAEPYPGHPAWDVYVGDWLGTYTEVTVDRATKQVVNTLVEID
jgi:hypothetical protein